MTPLEIKINSIIHNADAQTLDEYRESMKEISRWTLEQVMPEEKEQLDKNDPDNYGACYAIGGWNHSREHIINKATELGI